MIRRGVIAIAGLVVLAGPALAAGPLDRVLNELSRLGYGNVAVESTLLGRTRITASSDEADREIIVDPRTGEVLRDLWLPRLANGDGTSGTSGASTSSDDDVDDDDDDDDDDHSGHGSGGDDGGDDGGGGDNSGHGSGGGDDD